MTLEALAEFTRGVCDAVNRKIEHRILGNDNLYFAWSQPWGSEERRCVRAINFRKIEETILPPYQFGLLVGERARQWQ